MEFDQIKSKKTRIFYHHYFISKRILKDIIKLKNNILYLIILIIHISLSNQKRFIKLNHFSEITITIKGSGNQTILSQIGMCDTQTTFNSLPSKIYVNDILQNYTDYKVYDLQYNINKIRMEWNYTFTDCSGMFYDLRNITEMDLSKFNSSKVTNMR